MKKMPAKQRFKQLLHLIFAPLFLLFFRVRVDGRENLPTEGGAVIAVNHISFMDTILLAAAFPRRRMPHFLAKSELFRIPLLRGIIRFFGAISLDRGGKDVGAMRLAIATVQEGELLAIFPQGTRQKGKNPADTPIKSGVAMIAAHAGVPILPVCLSMKKNRYAFMRKIHLKIGRMLTPEELSLDSETKSYQRAAQTAFRAVCELGGYLPTPKETDS